MSPFRHPDMNEKPKPESTFTGRRLDLLRALRFDRTVDDYAKLVMHIIVDHLNEKTETAFLSDDKIAFETGSGWSRKVGRARRKLREAGWLSWKHTRTANVYTINWAKADDILIILKRERDAKNKKFQQSDSGR